MIPHAGEVHVGFTGTQLGMTDPQRMAYQRLMVELGATDLHHGDCVGADRDAHLIGVVLGVRTHLHPPTISTKRAFCDGDILYPPREYLVRNRDIVNASGCLIATPHQADEIDRSGTWSTVRYARKVRRPICIICPDGSVSRENYNAKVAS